MIYPRHIPLTERKALCGRLLYLDAANRFGLALPADKSTTSFNTLLLAHIKLEVDIDKRQRESEKQRSASPKPLKPLDTSLRDAIDNFSGMPAYSNITITPLSQSLMRSISTKVRALDCKACSGSARICDGVAQTNDDRLVHVKGDCISQLRKMFEVARDVAQAYYSEYARNFPSNPTPDIVFSTQHAKDVSETQHPLFRVFAGAQTCFVDQAGEPRAETQLTLITNKEGGFKLDLYTYKGILYLMFHECIAHAFHGLLPTFEGRETTRPYDRFAEGFMDQVAYMVLEEAVKDIGLSKRFGFQKRIAFPDSLQVAASMYANRNLCEWEEFASPNSELARGVQAATSTVRIIEKAYKSEDFGRPDDYLQGFYRLAFDLNVRQGLDRKRINRFLALMNDHQVLSTLSPPSLDKQDVLLLLHAEAVVADYLYNQDINQLLAAV